MKKLNFYMVFMLKMIKLIEKKKNFMLEVIYS